MMKEAPNKYECFSTPNIQHSENKFQPAFHANTWKRKLFHVYIFHFYKMSSTVNKEETTSIEFVDLKVLKDQGIKLFCKEKCLLKPSVYCECFSTPQHTTP